MKLTQNKNFDLSIPDNVAVIYNHLTNDKDINLLHSDLLAISLPNSYFIDVSWYPEFSLHGHYYITLFHLTWENKKIEIICKSLLDVKLIVESIVKLSVDNETRTNKS